MNEKYQWSTLTRSGSPRLFPNPFFLVGFKSHIPKDRPGPMLTVCHPLPQRSGPLCSCRITLSPQCYLAPLHPLSQEQGWSHTNHGMNCKDISREPGRYNGKA